MNRNVYISCILGALGLWVGTAPALAVQHPPPQSSARRAVLDAMRPAVEAKLGPNVEFVVDYIGIENGWAFVQAEPQRKGGKKINGKAYFRNDWQHMDGLTATAVLRFQYGRWNLVESRIGATDGWYCGEMPVARWAPCGQ
jgi:hypothetical protein